MAVWGSDYYKTLWAFLALGWQKGQYVIYKFDFSQIYLCVNTFIENVSNLGKYNALGSIYSRSSIYKVFNFEFEIIDTQFCCFSSYI